MTTGVTTGHGHRIENGQEESMAAGRDPVGYAIYSRPPVAGGQVILFKVSLIRVRLTSPIRSPLGIGYSVLAPGSSCVWHGMKQYSICQIDY